MTQREKAARRSIAEMRALVADHPTWKIFIRSFAGKGLTALPPYVSIDARCAG